MRHLTALTFAILLPLSSPAWAQDGTPDAVEAVEAAPEAAPVEDAAPAPAEEPAEEGAEEPKAPSADQIEATTESVSLLVDALQSKNWALAIGILLSLLVSFANRFGLKDKVGSKALPWVTSAVAVLGAIGAALMAGVSIMEAASQGLVAGVAAIGGWEMVLKHLLAPKKSVPAAAEE
jgi:hypothetical protein